MQINFEYNIAMKYEVDKHPVDKEQVTDFHLEVVELVKKYQFRDRKEMVKGGISVSQCYILESLRTFGDLSVSELADKMHLSISTITRVVDQLVKKKLVQRIKSELDKRVYICRLTQLGDSVYEESWNSIFESEKEILSNFSSEQRPLLISFLKQLNHAVARWHKAK